MKVTFYVPFRIPYTTKNGCSKGSRSKDSNLASSHISRGIDSTSARPTAHVGDPGALPEPLVYVRQQFTDPDLGQ